MNRNQTSLPQGREALVGTSDGTAIQYGHTGSRVESLNPLDENFGVTKSVQNFPKSVTLN
jgi:hypothetical protein